MEDVVSQFPESIMNPHDPNDDPFAGLPDYSTNQLQSPLEYGSGISYFVRSDEKEELASKQEPSSSSTDDDKPVDGNNAVKGGEKEHIKEEK
jgi:hypothetical protein